MIKKPLRHCETTCIASNKEFPPKQSPSLVQKMKQYFALILIIFSLFCFTGCDRNETVLLFNHNPITKETITNYSREFQAGEKIYYIFVTKKPLVSDIIQVKIMKMDEKVNYAPTKLAFADRYRLSKGQMNYYTDYVVFHEAGYYSMFIYSDEIPHPLAIEPFRVSK